jgi:hypothetical protein
VPPSVLVESCLSRRLSGARCQGCFNAHLEHPSLVGAQGTHVLAEDVIFLVAGRCHNSGEQAGIAEERPDSDSGNVSAQYSD